MAVFDKASLVMIPSQYKEGKIYNIKPEDQSSSFEFERGSAATRVNSSGLIEYVGIGSELASNNTILNAGGGVATIDGLSVSALSDGTASSTIRPRIDFNDLVNGETYLITFSNITTTGTIGFSLYNGSSYEFNQQSEIPSQYVFTKNSGADAFIAFNGNVIFTANFDISLKQISNDTPRLDYSGTEPALLLEPQRTNLITESNNFSSWTQANSTVTQGNVSLPTTSNSWSLVDDDNQGYHQVYKTFTPTANLDYSLSIFVKPVNATQCTLAFGGGGYGGNRSVFYSLVGDGSISTQQANIDNSSITKIGEWYKITLSTNIGSGSGTTFMQLMPTVNGQQAYTGNNQEMILFGDIQLEQGSYATSYIPTNGQTETRLADVCQGGGDASVFNDSEGVLYAEFNLKDLNTTSIGIGINDDSLDSNAVAFHIYGGVLSAQVKSGGVLTSSISYGSLNDTDFYKLAIKYELNSVKFFANGSQVSTTDTSATMPSGLSKIDFYEYGYTSRKFVGNVKALHYFPEALTDTELQQLTTI